MESGKNPSVIKTLPMRLHAEGAIRRTNTITVHIDFLCLIQWEIIHATNSCPPIKIVLQISKIYNPNLLDSTPHTIWVCG